MPDTIGLEEGARKYIAKCQQSYVAIRDFVLKTCEKYVKTLNDYKYSVYNIEEEELFSGVQLAQDKNLEEFFLINIVYKKISRTPNYIALIEISKYFDDYDNSEYSYDEDLGVDEYLKDKKETIIKETERILDKKIPKIIQKSREDFKKFSK